MQGEQSVCCSADQCGLVEMQGYKSVCVRKGDKIMAVSPIVTYILPF